MDILLILIGLSLLVTGGEALLRGSVVIAGKLGLSTLLVSMVIVGFGTSAPELMVSVASTLKGAPNIALGNVVGSNIANVLLILGLSAILTPIAYTKKEVRRDALVVLLASFILIVVSLSGVIGRLSGLLLLTGLITYMSYSYIAERKNPTKDKIFQKRIEEDIGNPTVSLAKAFTLCFLGLLFLAGGAHLFVEGATKLAEKLGIPNAIIGLTLVAVGTSLPELATALVAAYRKHSDVVIGNIMGSNLFNILGILGVTAIISPIPFEGRIANTDVWIMLVLSIVLLPVIWTGHKISRVEGGMFLTLYLIYIVWLFASGA